jgi:hypothetical protein
MAQNEERLPMGGTFLAPHAIPRLPAPLCPSTAWSPTIAAGAGDQNVFFPPSGRVRTRKISFPRRPGVTLRGKSRSPAGRRPFYAQKAKPPRGNARLHGKMSIPRHPMSNISLEMFIPHGGRPFSGSARCSLAGERDFPLQMGPGRRGICILTAKLPFPRGGTRFSAANGARTAGD